MLATFYQLVTKLGTSWGHYRQLYRQLYRHYLLHSLGAIPIHEGSKERSLLGKASKPSAGTSIQ
jgi:hypothetical protein